MGGFRIRVKDRVQEGIEDLILDLTRGTPMEGRVFWTGWIPRDTCEGPTPEDLEIGVGIPDGGGRLTDLLCRIFTRAVLQLQPCEGPHTRGLFFKTDLLYRDRIYPIGGGRVYISNLPLPTSKDPTSPREDPFLRILLDSLSKPEIRDLVGLDPEDLPNQEAQGQPVEWEKVISEDPLRMLRLVRFQGEYGFGLPLEVVKIFRIHAKRLRGLSPNKIRDELISIAKTGDLAGALSSMRFLGILRYILPEIHELREIEDMGPNHQEGSAFVHTVMVTSRAKKGVVPQLAALLHDVGKISTQGLTPQGETCFPGHEEASSVLARRILRRLRFDPPVINKVSRVVAAHMKPYPLEGAPKEIYRKFIQEAGSDLWDILDLALADSQGKNPPYDLQPVIDRICQELQELTPLTPKPPTSYPGGYRGSPLQVPGLGKDFEKKEEGLLPSSLGTDLRDFEISTLWPVGQEEEKEPYGNRYRCLGCGTEWYRPKNLGDPITCPRCGNFRIDRIRRKDGNF